MAVTQRRKLLKAAVGVASVSYVVACGIGGKADGGEVTSGNLTAPPVGYQFPDDRGGTGGSNGNGGAAGYGNITSGNLMPAPVPPPCCTPAPPVPPIAQEDAGSEDAAVPGRNEGDAAADAALAVDSGP